MGSPGKRIRVFGWETAGGAEQHFRIDLPWTAIDTQRFELYRGGEAQLRAMHRDGAIDVVFAHRLAGPSPLWHAICDDPNVLAVYDMDDDILRIDPANVMPYQVFHPLEAETRRNVDHADIITVSSFGLLRRYRDEHNRPRVYMLPMVIPDWMPELPLVDSRKVPHLVVGWAGSMHKAQDWDAVGMADVLAKFAALHPEARFATIGGDYTRGLLGAAHTHRGFTSVRDYYESIDFGVGLAPLMSSPFNDGKTTTKLIEYGARGVATIASAVGDYPRWIVGGYNGFLVNTPEGWAEGLEAFTDPVYRNRLGFNAWITAREFVISNQVHHWERVFAGEV